MKLYSEKTKKFYEWDKNTRKLYEILPNNDRVEVEKAD